MGTTCCENCLKQGELPGYPYDSQIEGYDSSEIVQPDSESAGASRKASENKIGSGFIVDESTSSIRTKKAQKLSCPICLANINDEQKCPVECGHILHKNCLVEHFRTQIESKKLGVLCFQDNCGQEISITDIQKYIPREIVNKYFEFTFHEYIEKQKDVKWCFTPSCKTVMELEEFSNNFLCPTCNIEYCADCQTKSHQGISCSDNMNSGNVKMEEREFQDLAKEKNFKKCPSCKFWVEKNRGCDHMTCRCGFEFCFRCGAESGCCDCDEADSFYLSDEISDLQIGPRRVIEIDSSIWDQANQNRSHSSVLQNSDVTLRRVSANHISSFRSEDSDF